MVKEKTKMTKKECVKKISELREIAELNIVASLFIEPNLYFEHDELTLDTFTLNKSKVFFQIGYDIVVKEQKTLEPITVDLYLQKHLKLKDKYEEYGGHEIFKTGEYVQISNINSYIEELEKYKILIMMIKEGFDVPSRFSDYIDMTTDEIYAENECILNNIFSTTNSLGRDKVYGIGHNIRGLIDKLNEGSQVGLPFYNMDLYNKTTMGLNLGNCYLIAGLSGSGKSSLIRNAILPSIVEQNERILLVINEEDLESVQKNLLIFVANNIYKKPLQKYMLNSGGYNEEMLKFLNKCADWLEENDDKIKVLALSSYSCDNVIKIIKKFSMLGYKYFCLDTFKKSADSKDEAWKSMMDDSVRLYDLCKPSGLNVCLVITAQIKKSASRNKELTQGDLGQSTNIIDVMSVAFFTRALRPEEMPSGGSPLKVFRKTKNGSKIPVTLEEDKHYVVGSFMKNRFGSCDLSIVFEHDLSKNIISECGYCICME